MQACDKAIKFRGVGGEQSIIQARLCEVLGECLVEFDPVCISEVAPWRGVTFAELHIYPGMNG